MGRTGVNLQVPIEKIWIFAPSALLWSGLEALLRADGFRVHLDPIEVETVNWNDCKFDDAIIILGADNPVRQTIAHIQAIEDAGSSTPVILVLGSTSQDCALPAISAGARGIICEEDDAQNLLTCVREVAHGRDWVSQSVISMALETGLDAPGSVFAQLTARERQVADMIASGRSTDGVADALEMAPGTVKVHLHNIFKKLEIPDRSQLIRRILEEKARG